MADYEANSIMTFLVFTILLATHVTRTYGESSSTDSTDPGTDVTVDFSFTVVDPSSDSTDLMADSSTGSTMDMTPSEASTTAPETDSGSSPTPTSSDMGSSPETDSGSSQTPTSSDMGSSPETDSGSSQTPTSSDMGSSSDTDSGSSPTPTSSDMGSSPETDSGSSQTPTSSDMGSSFATDTPIGSSTDTASFTDTGISPTPSSDSWSDTGNTFSTDSGSSPTPTSDSASATSGSTSSETGSSPYPISDSWSDTGSSPTPTVSADSGSSDATPSSGSGATSTDTGTPTYSATQVSYTTDSATLPGSSDASAISASTTDTGSTTADAVSTTTPTVTTATDETTTTSAASREAVTDFVADVENITNPTDLESIVQATLDKQANVNLSDDKEMELQMELRAEMVNSVRTMVVNAPPQTLEEAITMGNTMDVVTIDTDIMLTNTMRTSVETSRMILEQGRAYVTTIDDAIKLSQAVSKPSSNLLDAAFVADEGEIVSQKMMPDVDLQQESVSRSIAKEQNALLDEMTAVLSAVISKLDHTEDVAISQKSFNLKVGRRSKKQLAENHRVTSSDVEVDLAEDLLFDSTIDIQMTTFKKNPYTYGRNSRWTNTPTSSLRVRDRRTGQSAQPSLFSGNGYAMSSSLNTNLKAGDVTVFTVKAADIPPQGQLHTITISQTGMNLIFTYEQTFLGHVTMYGQMDIQPGVNDYDFKVSISEEDIGVQSIHPWKLKATVTPTGTKLFIYGSGVRKKGKLKLLVLADSVTLVRQRRRLLSVLPVNAYVLSVMSIQPWVWNEGTEAWDVKDWVQVLPESTTSNIKFTSNFFGSIAAGLFVPPNTIDFADIFPNFLQRLRESPHVFGVVVSLFVLSALLLVWARYKDRQDRVMWLCPPLVDNDPDDRYQYRLDVSTSSRYGAGTTANVFIILIGENDATIPHALYDGFRQNFQRGCVSSFLLTTPRCLGRIQYVFLWHDNSGTDPDWAMNHLVVTDVKLKQRDFFMCGQWFSAARGDNRTNRLFRVTHEENVSDVRQLFKRHAVNFLFDSHVWFSVFKRPNKSRFTRVQRLLCCISAISLVMITNAMWFRTGGTSGASSTASIGPFRVSFRTVFIGLMSSVIILPPTVAMTLIFQKVKWRKRTHVVEAAFRPTITAQTNKHPRPQVRLLPWWCVHIAYALAFLSIVCGAFFTILYSLEWGEELSLEWLSSLLLSLIETIIIIQPIKVFLIALLLTCVLQLPTETDEHLEADLLHESTTLEQQPFDERVPRPGLIPDLPDDLDNVLEDPATVEARRSMDKKLFSTGRQTGIQIAFLILVIILCNGNRGYHYYQQNTSLKQAYPVIEHMIDFNALYYFVLNYALPQIYPTLDYNGQALSEYDKTFESMMVGLRIGPARIRQYRVKETACYWWIQDDVCGSDWTSHSTDWDDYLPDWQPANAGYNTKTPFTLTNSHKNDMPIIGKFATYHGSSYLASLGRSSEEAYLVTSQLKATNWLDRHTRAVILELSTYNAFVNLMSGTKYVIEMPAVGGIFMTRTVQSFRPYPYVTTWDIVYLMFQIIFLLALLYIIYLEIRIAISLKLMYIKDFWTYVVVCAVTTSFLSIGLFIWRTYLVIKAIEDVKNNIGEYVSFDIVVLLDQYYTNALACVAFLCILQILRPLSFNYFFALMKTTLKKANMILLGCSLFLFLTWISFGQSMYLILVRSTKEFGNFIQMMWTMYRISFGFLKYGQTFLDDTVYNRLTYLAFMITIKTVLMNLCITVYMDMYSFVQKSQNPDGFDRELNEHFWKRMQMLLAAITNKDESMWSLDMPISDSDVVRPLRPEQSYSMHRTADLVLRATMVGNFNKGISHEAEPNDTSYDAAEAWKRSMRIREELALTNQRIDEQEKVIGSIKNAINMAIIRDRQRDHFLKRPELWPEYRYFLPGGRLACTVRVLPGGIRHEDLSLSKLEDLQRPDTVSCLSPTITLNRNSVINDEETVYVSIPLSGDITSTSTHVLTTEVVLVKSQTPGALPHEVVEGKVKVDSQLGPIFESKLPSLPHSMAVQRILKRTVAVIDDTGGHVTCDADNTVRMIVHSQTFERQTTVTLQTRPISVASQGTSPILLLTVSNLTNGTVRLTAPFLENTDASSMPRVLHLVYRRGMGEWQEDFQSVVYEDGQCVSFNVSPASPGEILSVFIKSGHASWANNVTHVVDPVTDVYLRDLGRHLADSWRTLSSILGVPCLKEHGDEGKAQAVLRKWFYSQEMGTDKVSVLKDALNQLNRPDLMIELIDHAEAIKRNTMLQVQAANLTKAITAVIRSTAVAIKWRHLAVKLAVPDHVTESLSDAEMPLSSSEKLFEVLKYWRGSDERACVEKLRSCLEEMNCHTAARKLAQYSMK